MSADEEKTRVLQRRSAKPDQREAAAEKIVFWCPNRHRIVAPGDLAGKQGKCSKCGVAVMIPPSSEMAPADGKPADQPPLAAAADVPAAGPPEAGNNPVKIQPLPTPDGKDAEAPIETAKEGGAGEGDEPESWDFIGGQAEPSVEEGFAEGDWSAVSGSAGFANDASEGFAADGGNPTALLVARLWAERQHGGIIELHLEGGSVILPQWYDANWSRGTHGLFASQGADGSVTLTAVAWDTVRKVVVRQLTEVPNDMFI